MTGEPAANQAASNPFATRFIKPGALDFVFAAERESLETLLTKLEAHGWRGEIVGPHGSGKSTLLRTLIPCLTAMGKHVTLFSLRDNTRSLPHIDSENVEWFPAAGALKPPRLWIVDGAEQLSLLNRWRVRWSCWWHNRGLLLTTHQPLGLPVLWQTTTSADLAWQLVGRLLPAGQQVIARADVEAAFHQHRGNLREALLHLFDVYQAKVR